MDSNLGKIFLFFLAVMMNTMAVFPDQAQAVQEKNKIFEGFVYFSDKNYTHLRSVKKQFPSHLDEHGLAVAIIQTLLKGPGIENLRATWPDKASLNALFITDKARAFIDIQVDPEMVQHMDARSEMLAVYSMANSLIVNIPKIRQIKILINGQDAQTLAGHIDLEFFYKTNMLIVK